MTVELRLRMWAGVLLVCGVSVGCSDSESKPPNGPVRGRVTLNGSPLVDVTVVFRNADTMAGVNVHTGTDGTYEIVSHQDKGLPPGKYQVAVRPKTEWKSDQEMMDHMAVKMKQKDPWAPPPKSKSNIPEKYHDPATSGFVVEVASNENPSFDFNLNAK